jgi:uncharacterized protein YceH (UPF0502 family)
MESSASRPPVAPNDPAPLSVLEARVLGCLIEKELATPDAYPLTLNALVNACNQRNNRDPLMEVAAREVEAALDQLRYKHLAVVFSGADARVPKFKQKLDAVYPMSAAARALLGELLLRGPQTLAGLRANAERMHAMPPVAEFDALFAELKDRPAGALVLQLPRQPGQKEARWTQLLTPPPPPSESRREAAGASAASEEPLKVVLTLPPEAERRFAALEAEVERLRAELARLRGALGEG